MSTLVSPHGGAGLKPLALAGEALAAERARARALPALRVSSREKGDLVMLGIGGFTPLEGFMTHADWQGVCDGYRTAAGLFWPIPITLSTDTPFSAGSEIALADPDDGELLATMRVTEQYSIDKAHECATVFRTTDPAHPGVAMVMAQGRFNLAGPVKVLSDGGFRAKYGRLFMTPAETRAEFERLDWSRVAAFQTRNPMHRSHEYLAKVAIEVCDGVLVHSLLGALKPGDIPAEVRTRAIALLIEKYFRPGTVVQAGYPLDMRYAGPREALLHALFRQNYGCSHLLVGRDHAGVGSYYGPFDAHHIFDEIPRDALETRPLKIDWTFWCYKCGGMASGRTCPHGDADRLLVSGTQLRKWLSEGSAVPPEYSRPEVLEVLRAYYADSVVGTT
ncbi:MAG TPA: sulfate adenylyltransferase [Burkholderiales bacterium]|nr:sulfate adenylyltransferase [Burkholderiales bacterium]